MLRLALLAAAAFAWGWTLWWQAIPLFGTKEPFDAFFPYTGWLFVAGVVSTLVLPFHRFPPVIGLVPLALILGQVTYAATSLDFSVSPLWPIGLLFGSALTAGASAAGLLIGPAILFLARRILSAGSTG